MAGMKPDTLARVQVYKEPIDFKAPNPALHCLQSWMKTYENMPWNPFGIHSKYSERRRRQLCVTREENYIEYLISRTSRQSEESPIPQSSWVSRFGGSTHFQPFSVEENGRSLQKFREGLSDSMTVCTNRAFWRNICRNHDYFSRKLVHVPSLELLRTCRHMDSIGAAAERRTDPAIGHWMNSVATL